MAFFTQDQLEAIAGALGDTDAGLTGTEIQYLLASSKMTDPGPVTKRVRIYNAFVESQNTKKNRTNILQFIRLAMKPARYSRQPERYEPMRALLNQALAFAGLVVDEAGNLTSTEAAQTLPEAQRRARDLRADLEVQTEPQDRRHLLRLARHSTDRPARRLYRLLAGGAARGQSRHRPRRQSGEQVRRLAAGLPTRRGRRAGDGIMNAPSPFFPSTDDPRIRLRVLSLGAGVQSTTLALMAAHGIVGPVPDCAIFADTGWEPRAVYEHLDWLISPNVLPFPVHIVSAGNIRANLAKAATGGRWASIPAFTRTERDGKSQVDMIRRQCTKEYKIVPIRRKVRELAGLTRRRSPDYPVVEQWIGISADEVLRMKPSFENWQVNRWPLVEQRMSQQDCLAWLGHHGYPEPPKSSCIGCPFHSDAMWRAMRDGDAEAWADVIAVDRMIRTGLRGVRGEVYLHRQTVPLDRADLSTAADHGQLDLWGNECEGMCGV